MAFDPRSLVGMSMAARRKLAEAQYRERVAKLSPAPTQPQKGDYLKRATAGLEDGWRLMSAQLLSDPNGVRYIAPRLRPCPGCMQCLPAELRPDINGMVGTFPNGAEVTLRAWVKLSGWRGPFYGMRRADDDTRGNLGDWTAWLAVHSPSGERIGGGWRDVSKRAARDGAAGFCMIQLFKRFGWPKGCDGSGVLPARKQQKRT